MKRLFLAIALILILLNTSAQSLNWRANAFGFADNREYSSTVQVPQSILGIQFAPELFLAFDSVHTLNVGFNALKEFGSIHEVDKVNPYFYYALSNKSFDFHFGIFPRNIVHADSPKAIYYDSLSYYRPYISGLFWTYKKGGFKQSVYLDWTSRQTANQREAFIMGGKGSYSSGIFFAQNHLYMYHFAHTAIPQEDVHLRDNGVAVLSLGLNFAEYTFLDSLKFSISGIKSFERERNVSDWKTPNGLIVDFNAEYKGLGINNTYYYGNGHRLDWGDPFYRLKQYNRTDIYYKVLGFKKVAGLFTYSLHFAEGSISHQQQFTLIVELSLGFNKRE
ncbi:MAG: hypothetical protein PHS05_02120 [Bacteroidales bacterium]|nr:hypothetical protein [Bacteroidales bacterium]